MKYNQLYFDLNVQLQYCKIIDGSIKLKLDHAYYFQIMGQLHISRRQMCYFVIYTSNWMNIEIIEYDNSFWENKMVNKLKTFVILFHTII